MSLCAFKKLLAIGMISLIDILSGYTDHRYQGALCSWAITDIREHCAAYHAKTSQNAPLWFWLCTWTRYSSDEPYLPPVFFTCIKADFLQWADEIKLGLCPENVPIVLAATKIDIRNEPKTIEQLARQLYSEDQLELFKLVTKDEGEAMARKIGAYSFVECTFRDKVGQHQRL